MRAVNFFGSGPSGTSTAVTTAGAGVSYRSVVMADGPSHYYRLGDLALGGTATDYSGNTRNLSYEPSGLTAGMAGALTGDSDGRDHECRRWSDRYGDQRCPAHWRGAPHGGGVVQADGHGLPGAGIVGHQDHQPGRHLRGAQCDEP